MAGTLTLPTPPASWPGEDELPYSDGIPSESQRHVLQGQILTQVLAHAWAERQDFFTTSNMFVYFSPDQVLTRDFRGPDVFVAVGVRRRERKSWVTWQEGKPPDVVIELPSETTEVFDRTEKKRIYQDELQVPEYFWFHPVTTELSGFELREGVYVPIEPDAAGALESRRLGLKLVRWTGEFEGVDAEWLRWATLDRHVLPTPTEALKMESRRADQERLRAQRLAERLRALGVDPDA
jgi:Uma2 family endonuclease